MYLELFHGREIDPVTGDTPDMEDWGTQGPVFEINSMHSTYASDIKIDIGYKYDAVLYYHEDMIYYDGIAYGDFYVSADCRGNEERIEEFDQKKAIRPKYLRKQP